MTKRRLARMLRQIDGHILKANINLGHITSSRKMVKNTRLELDKIFRILMRIAQGNNISLKEWKEAGR